MGKKIVLPRITSNDVESKKFYTEVSGLMALIQETLILSGVEIEDEYYNSLEAVTSTTSELFVKTRMFHIVCEGEKTKKMIEFHVKEDGKIFIFFSFFNITTGKWKEFESWLDKTTDFIESNFDKIINSMK
jgi:hypothetical protein